MSTIYLKVKIKSLAEEARIIRKEEGKAKAYKRRQGNTPEASALFWGLRYHRTSDVRDEARATQLAYAFLRDRPYGTVECPRVKCPRYILQRVTTMATKYGPDKTLTIADVEAWVANPAESPSRRLARAA